MHKLINLWTGLPIEQFQFIRLFEQIMSEITKFFSDPAIWTLIVWTAVKIVLIYMLGKIVVRISVKAVSHVFIERERNPLKFDPRRTRTIGKLISNIISYTVNFMVIMMVLKQIGFELAPLLAGAGVVGLAIGFGAQNLVRDVISGFFIIFEEQFSVGDTIQTGAFKGTVEEIGLRVTKLKNETNDIHIIPNGSITLVTNFSMSNSVGVIHVRLLDVTAADRAYELIKAQMKKVSRHSDNVVKEPQVVKLEKPEQAENVSASPDVMIKVSFECKPATHVGVGKIIKEQIKSSLSAENIEIHELEVITYQRDEKVGS